MCIICNLRDPQRDVFTATGFLHDYSAAQKAMKTAADSMLAVIALDLPPEVRTQYKRIHKVMVRQCRDWNMIEHQREQCTNAAHALAQVDQSPSGSRPERA